MALQCANARRSVGDMTSIPDAVEALENAIRHEEACKEALAAAKLMRRNLERFVLPPLFVAARQKKYEHEDGTIAVKALGTYARWPTVGKSDDPTRPGLSVDEAAKRRQAALIFLEQTGNLNSLKAVVSASWGRGEYELAQAVYAKLQKDTSAKVHLTENIHWKTYENIVLDAFQRGVEVPFSEIGAEVYDQVTLTKRRGTEE